MENRMLNEENIGDIILCEPITRKGREALNRLGLTTEDITPAYFYNNIRVSSKYESNKEYENKVFDQINDGNCLYYQYTVDYIQFETIKDRLKRFNSRFCSNSPNEYPLLMLGVAGNGKSIEINRRIREIKSETTEFDSSRMYFDLEDSFTKITYGDTYQCPSDTPLWLFCIKLIDGIMQYIKSFHFLCPTILNNFNNIVVKKNLANKKQKELFQNIGNYCNNDNDTETKIFCSLKSILSSQNESDDIQALLEILMWIMYCSAPNKKQYIVIDNIEQYIKLNNSKIQIPNSDITRLYKFINIVVMNMTNAFGRIEKDLGWKAFKIIIVLRRTSLGLLDSTLLHSTVKAEQNITDITGHFQIPDIWANKKIYVWDKKLKNKFSNEENKKIIKLIDIIMNDGDKTVGINYQSIIAPLMSYGIRRNAKAQAHAIYNTYTILTNNDNRSINFDEFSKLISAKGRDNSPIRYMFRRALMEFQFKWSISSGDQNRWESLGIGHLTGKKEHFYNGKKFMIEGVSYHNNKYVTLVRRILTYLSCFPEKNNTYAYGQYKSVVDMFATISLYDLIRGVLINPIGHNPISDEDYLQFSRVIIALSDMSNGDTKSAPYIILGINDNRFHINADASVLAEILKEINDAGYKKSLPGEKYNCSDFGARITDAGYSFLLDWQASFSFIFSIHCFTIPSLFFLKDVSIIKYVIETVYVASFSLCKMYEDEAERFCGGNVTLKTGTYLPKQKNKYITYKQRVIELHVNHLNLYRDFLEKNYDLLAISEDDMLNLTSHSSGFISKYINKYNNWKNIKEVRECF